MEGNVWAIVLHGGAKQQVWAVLAQWASSVWATECLPPQLLARPPALMGLGCSMARGPAMCTWVQLAFGCGLGGKFAIPAGLSHCDTALDALAEEKTKQPC